MDVMKIQYDSSINNEELIIKAKSGDNVAKELLFQNNIPFIRRLANRWKRKGSSEDFEELISIGLWGMVRAYNGYDPKTGAKFITYLERTVVNLYKNNATEKSVEWFTRFTTVSMDLTLDEDGENTYHDMIGNHDESINEIFNGCNLNTVHDFINKVGTEREKEVFEKVFIIGMTQTEIAAQHKCSREAISQVYRNMIKMLQTCFKNKIA